MSAKKKPAGRPRKLEKFDDTVLGRLAYNLRRLRRRAGLGTVEAAERAEIPKTIWYRWEAGKGWPSHEQLVQAAEALDADISELLRKMR